MINIETLAIADVLVHSKLGLISYQPYIHDPISNEKIPARDIRGKLYWVDLSDCSYPENQIERDRYWREFPEVFPEDEK